MSTLRRLRRSNPVKVRRLISVWIPVRHQDSFWRSGADRHGRAHHLRVKAGYRMLTMVGHGVADFVNHRVRSVHTGISTYGRHILTCLKVNEAASLLRSEAVCSHWLAIAVLILPLLEGAEHVGHPESRRVVTTRR